MEHVRTAGELRAKSAVLDDWCTKLGRDPRQIERTVAVNAGEVGDWQAYLDAGAEHLILMTGPPFDLDPLRKLLVLGPFVAVVSSPTGSSASALPIRRSDGVAEPSANSYAFSHRK